jgi:hypothetical protein
MAYQDVIKRIYCEFCLSLSFVYQCSEKFSANTITQYFKITAFP